jgi:hypothetical protein
MAGIKKLANERAKKASVHNKKLRDCRLHYNEDEKEERRYESTLFITEGDSASGSITKSRDVQTQAVFSLRGKPLNCYGLTKKIVYENEEFNLLQHALNIEEGIEGLTLQQYCNCNRCRCGRNAYPFVDAYILLTVFSGLSKKRTFVYFRNTPLPGA